MTISFLARRPSSPTPDRGSVPGGLQTDRSEGARGISLIVMEADRPGFQRGRRLKKLGTKAQDTSELFFGDVRVPASNLIGEEGKGFAYMMKELAWERMHVGIQAVSCCEAALDGRSITPATGKRSARAVIDFQNSRFKLAEMKTEVQVGRVFLDRCLDLVLAGKLDTTTAAMVKLWTSEMQGKVLDACLQLHADTGSCGNIRLPGPLPMRGCSGFMRGRMRL